MAEDVKGDAIDAATEEGHKAMDEAADKVKGMDVDEAADEVKKAGDSS